MAPQAMISFYLLHKSLVILSFKLIIHHQIHPHSYLVYQKVVTNKEKYKHTGWNIGRKQKKPTLWSPYPTTLLPGYTKRLND